jgi:predicted Zn-dependent peptidase
VRIKGRINVTEFDNGIYLYSVANSNFNLSAIGFRSGSIHDPQGLSGMNHLIEHMSCRRGVKYSERDVERIFNRYMGGTHGEEINVRCNRSSVLYGHDDLRRREYMWKCFDMYADAIKSVMRDAYGLGPHILDLRALKVEKGAIHNEHRLRGTDVAEDHIYDLVHWHLYRTNPARRRIDCGHKALRKITLEQARQFVLERYTTESMFVILIGPKNNEAVEKVREYFGDLPQSSPTPLDYDHSDDFPVLDGIRSFELVRPGIRQSHVAIAFPTVIYTPKDPKKKLHPVALDVLTAIWEYRIEQRLREENTRFNAGIYHPDHWLPRTFTHGMAAAWFATVGDDRYVERAIAMAVEECEKLKTDESEIFNEDCEDKKAYLNDSFEQMLLCYPRILCEAITDATCNGDPKLKGFVDYQKRLSGVTPKILREVANEYFTTPGHFVKVIIKPMFVPQRIINMASDEVKPYLLAINHDPDFSE